MLTIIYYWIKQNWFTFACYYTRIRKHLIYKSKKKFFTCMCPSWDVFFRAFVKRASVNIVITRTALRKKKRSALKVKKKQLGECVSKLLGHVHLSIHKLYLHMHVSSKQTCTRFRIVSQFYGIFISHAYRFLKYNTDKNRPY